MHASGKGVLSLWGNRGPPKCEGIKTGDDLSAAKEPYGLVFDGGGHNNDSQRYQVLISGNCKCYKEKGSLRCD